MSNLEKLFHQYCELVVNDKGIEAIDQFYHDNIHQYENDQEPLIGKAILRAKEIAISNEVTLKFVEIFNFIIDKSKNRVTGEMIFEFIGKESGLKRLTEKFIQIWIDDKIVEQRFFYEGVENL